MRAPCLIQQPMTAAFKAALACMAVSFRLDSETALGWFKSADMVATLFCGRRQGLTSSSPETHALIFRNPMLPSPSRKERRRCRVSPIEEVDVEVSCEQVGKTVEGVLGCD